jgi:hypothetical protein
LSGYLLPVEHNLDVLQFYVDAIREQRLSAARGGVFFWLAVHHLSCNIFGEAANSPTPRREEVLRKLRSVAEPTREIIFRYVYSPEAAFPPQLENLPPLQPERLKLIDL